MEKVGEYRLIWFQHLHKAAGTLIVNMAKANNEVLHNPNNNGNPSDEKGSTMPLWKYDKSRLLDFINDCAKKFSIILTKIDKISPKQSDFQKNSVLSLMKNYKPNFQDIYLSETKKNNGINEIQKAIYDLL